MSTLQDVPVAEAARAAVGASAVELPWQNFPEDASEAASGVAAVGLCCWGDPGRREGRCSELSEPAGRAHAIPRSRPFPVPTWGPPGVDVGLS